MDRKLKQAANLAKRAEDRSNRNQIDTTQRGLNVKSVGASGSIIETVGTIVSNTNVLNVMDVIDFEVGQGIRIPNAAPVYETRTIVFSSDATGDFTIEIHFDESVIPVSISNGDTKSAIAAKIRSTVVQGWSFSGTGDTINCTALTAGRKLLYLVRSTTSLGGSSTNTVTLAGRTDLVTVVESVSTGKLKLRDAATATVFNVTVYHDDTEALYNAFMSPVPYVLIPKGNYNYYQMGLVRDSLEIQGLGANLISWIPVAEPLNAFHIIGSNIAVRGINFKYNRPFNVDTTFKPQSFPGGNNHIRLGGERWDKPNAGWRENITIEDCTVDGGYGGGIDIYFASRCFTRRNRVTNTLGNGINYSNCKYDIFTEYNTVDTTRDDGIQNVCDSNWPDGTENYQVRHNRVLNSYAKGISTTGVASGLIEGNFVKNTWTGGLQPFRDSFYGLGGTTDIIIKDNIIVDAGWNFGGEGRYRTERSSNADGIYISNVGTTYITCEGNKIINAYRHGVTVSSGSRGIKLSKNKITKTTIGKGISIGDTSNVNYDSAFQIEVTKNEIYDAWEEAIVYGGVSEGLIEDNYIKNWNRRNEANVNMSPIRVGYLKNVRIKGNRFNNEITGYVGKLVYITGVNKNLLELDNPLFTDINDFAPNMIMIGSKKLAFTQGGKPVGFLWNQGDVSIDTEPSLRNKAVYSCVRTGRAAPLWTASTPVLAGDYIQPTSDNGGVYQAQNAGTTSATQPTWGTVVGGDTTDNDVVWRRTGTSALFRSNLGIDAVRAGQFTWTADGTNDNFTITHGLGDTPTYWHVDAINGNAGTKTGVPIDYITISSTAITVRLKSVPTASTQLRYVWSCGILT